MTKTWPLYKSLLLGGGFEYFLFSPRTLGKIPNLTNIFQMGWNHQLKDLEFYFEKYIPDWLLEEFSSIKK